MDSFFKEIRKNFQKGLETKKLIEASKKTNQEEKLEQLEEKNKQMVYICRKLPYTLQDNNYFLDMMQEAIFEIYSGDAQLLLDRLDQEILQEINEALLKHVILEKEIQNLKNSDLITFFEQEYKKIEQHKNLEKGKNVNVIQDLENFIKNQKKERER